MEKIALSVPGPNNTTRQLQAPEGIPSGLELGPLASGFIQVLTVVGILLSLVYLVYGGFFWLQSKGDKERLDKARRIILYAIFGLVIMSLSLVVVNLIASALGVKTVIGGA